MFAVAHARTSHQKLNGLEGRDLRCCWTSKHRHILLK